MEEPAHDSFVAWLKSVWLPSIHSDVKLLKMLDSPHEGHTYCIQLVVDDGQGIQGFKEDYLHILQQYIGTHYAEKVFLFDSTMEYLS